MDNSHMIKRIEIRLKEMGKSKSEFYKETGISSATFSQWNTGQFGPSKRKLYAISEYTGISIAELLGKEQKEKPPGEGELDNMLIDRLVQLTPEELEKVDAFVQGLIAAREV